ncbi:DUF397 domain-containing protein [Streptomyces sp. E11-3]|uniref:DUF397 domain-containing protein n=1 Tax=Streptomyces sp. E11-3 TaxID=3110112 RepID=UPI00397F647B
MTELNWQKSTFSEGQGDNCVYVAATDGSIHLRESDTPNVTLTTTPSALAAFIRSTRPILR